MQPVYHTKTSLRGGLGKIVSFAALHWSLSGQQRPISGVRAMSASHPDADIRLQRDSGRYGPLVGDFQTGLANNRASNFRWDCAVKTLERPVKVGQITKPCFEGYPGNAPVSPPLIT